MVAAASLALTLSRVAQRIEKQSVDYTLGKEKLLQSWRYKALAIIKRHKTHLSLSFNAGTRWRQSVLMSDNNRNKNVRSTPLVCKTGFTVTDD